MSAPDERAERLRVLLAYAGEERALAIDAGPRMGLPALTDDDLALLRSATADDLALANACIAAGRELRARQYRAAEEYLALAIPVGEDLRKLPADAAGRALWAFYVSGWAWLPDEDDPL